MDSLDWKIRRAVSAIMLTVAFLMAFSCGEKDDAPELSSKWLLITPSSYSLGTGDEFVISPEFSSDDVKDLDYVWTVSDPDVLSIVEDNNSSVTVLAVKPGKARVKVECPGETKRLSATVDFTVAQAPLRILAIGNSFSQDAVEQYLWDLFNAAGIEAVIGNMYIGGCSLEKHWTNAEENKAAYEYRKVVDGKKTNTKNISLETAIKDENWDYISLQQASDYSGMYEEYQPYLDNLVEYVRSEATNRNMRLMFHQTWAYASGSDHAAFPNYGNDQMTMYNAIVSASRRAMQESDIDILIPGGTAIQNGRSSYIGDKFNRDGYHLEVNYGRYTAACTWFETISGMNVLENGFVPGTVDEREATVARNAAHSAVADPYCITDMSEY